MSRPVLVDLFGAAGGGARGYQRAGFHVISVDHLPQPESCADEFVQADLTPIEPDGPLNVPSWMVEVADAWHASPPCQGRGYIAQGNMPELADLHPDLIPASRTFLESTGRPYVIENVGGSDVRGDIVLCGEMFGLGIIGHRKFELGRWMTLQPAHVPHRGYVRGWRHGVWRDGPYVAAYGQGGGKATVEEMRVAKGIDWMTDHLSLRDALPPAYTEWLGAQLMAHLRAGRSSSVVPGQGTAPDLEVAR